MIQSRSVIVRNSNEVIFQLFFFLCLLARRKNGYRYFHNIVLTEIKIHNMHCSLAFPLDSIRKLLCGNVKDTLTSATQHHSASLATAAVLLQGKYPEKRL